MYLPEDLVPAGKVVKFHGVMFPIPHSQMAQVDGADCTPSLVYIE